MHRSLPLSAIGLSLGLAGCGPPVVFVETSPAILVEPIDRDYVARVDRGGAMSPSERRRLASFLASTSGGRVDAIHLTLSSPAPGSRRAVAAAARAAGVEPFKIRETEEPGRGRHRGGVVVTARMYRANPPVCPDLDVTGPPFNDNDFEPTLGCSNLANLASMVNDPVDLIGNPAVRRADGERAALPVARYRAGPGDTAAGGGGGQGGGLQPVTRADAPGGVAAGGVATGGGGATAIR